MPRGGRNVPGLKEAWALKGKLLVKKYRGQVVVQAWPKAYGPPRSQAQADTITAFKQMQRAMKFQLPVEWVDAIESTAKTGMYPRDYLMSCMSGNMFMVQYMPGFAISAAIDMIADFTAQGGDTLFTINAIPQGYKGLLIRGLARSQSTGSFDALRTQFNTDTGAHYDTFGWFSPSGLFQTIGGTAFASPTINGSTAPANYPSPFEILIPNYTAPFFKTLQIFSTRIAAVSAGNNFQTFATCYWRSTAPLTRIDFTLPGKFVAASRITAYGLY